MVASGGWGLGRAVELSSRGLAPRQLPHATARIPPCARCPPRHDLLALRTPGNHTLIGERITAAPAFPHPHLTPGPAPNARLQGGSKAHTETVRRAPAADALSSLPYIKYFGEYLALLLAASKAWITARSALAAAHPPGGEPPPAEARIAADALPLVRLLPDTLVFRGFMRAAKWFAWMASSLGPEVSTRRLIREMRRRPVCLVAGGEEAWREGGGGVWWRDLCRSATHASSAFAVQGPAAAAAMEATSQVDAGWNGVRALLDLVHRAGGGAALTHNSNATINSSAAAGAGGASADEQGVFWSCLAAVNGARFWCQPWGPSP